MDKLEIMAAVDVAEKVIDGLRERKLPPDSLGVVIAALLGLEAHLRGVPIHFAALRVAQLAEKFNEISSREESLDDEGAADKN